MLLQNLFEIFGSYSALKIIPNSRVFSFVCLDQNDVKGSDISDIKVQNLVLTLEKKVSQGLLKLSRALGGIAKVRSIGNHLAVFFFNFSCKN